MYIIITLIIALVGIPIIFTSLVFLAIAKAKRPTQGKIIQNYINPQKALLVVDIQEDYTGSTAIDPFPYKHSDKLISTINSVIEAASESNLVVAYIAQELPDNFIYRAISKGRSIKGHPGTAFDARLHVVNKNYFSKQMSDSFSNPELESFLINNNVNEIFITGLDAEKCVYNTAKGALNRGCKVTIISDGVAGLCEDINKVFDTYKADGIFVISSSEFMNLFASDKKIH